MKGLFIGFIILQIGLDLAHSVTVFPFVHYGMYSESFPRPDSLEVFQVTADGRLLKPEELSPYRWDMVQTPLAAFEKKTRTEDFAFDKEKMGQGMRWAGLGAWYNRLKPNLDNTVGVESFASWYKRYLEGLLGHPIESLRVEKRWYRWQEGRMQLIRQAAYINLSPAA